MNKEHPYSLLSCANMPVTRPVDVSVNMGCEAGAVGASFSSPAQVKIPYVLLAPSWTPFPLPECLTVLPHPSPPLPSHWFTFVTLPAAYVPSSRPLMFLVILFVLDNETRPYSHPLRILFSSSASQPWEELNSSAFYGSLIWCRCSQKLLPHCQEDFLFFFFYFFFFFVLFKFLRHFCTWSCSRSLMAPEDSS